MSRLSCQKALYIVTSSRGANYGISWGLVGLLNLLCVCALVRGGGAGCKANCNQTLTIKHLGTCYHFKSERNVWGQTELKPLTLWSYHLWVWVIAECTKIQGQETYCLCVPCSLADYYNECIVIKKQIVTILCKIHPRELIWSRSFSQRYHKNNFHCVLWWTL